MEVGQTTEVFEPPQIGENATDTLVLLNGALASMVGLRPTARALASQGLKVVVYEWPGVGARLKEPMTEERVLDSLAQVIESLETRVVLFGYSMGGFVAMKYLAKYPDRVRAAVLGGCCWTGGIGLLRLAGLGYTVMSRQMTWSTMRSFFNLDKPESDLTEEDFQEMMHAGLFFQSWGGCVDVMAEPHENFYMHTLTALRESHLPCIILNGELDKAQKLTKEFGEYAGAQVHIIPQATHEGVLSPKHLDEAVQIVARFALEDSKKSQ